MDCLCNNRKDKLISSIIQIMETLPNEQKFRMMKYSLNLTDKEISLDNLIFEVVYRDILNDLQVTDLESIYNVLRMIINSKSP